MALLCIAADPGIRMRDIAAKVDITERATQRIVADLIEAGYLERQRVGRRNLYSVRTNLRIAVPDRRDLDLSTLLNVLLPAGSSAERRHAMPAPEGDEVPELLPAAAEGDEVPGLLPAAAEGDEAPELLPAAAEGDEAPELLPAAAETSAAAEPIPPPAETSEAAGLIPAAPAAALALGAG